MAENELVKIEKKWQKRWEKEISWDAELEEGRKKFFLIFAYPGISGYLHVGHMRGFTYSDVICRYKRQRGYNVMFPVGFHASGLPAISLAKRIQREDPATIQYLKRNGCPEEEIEKLKDVNYLIEFFSKVYINDYWKRFGFTIDLSRVLSTISPGYKRFITWQFLKLNEKGLLTKKPHYAPYCPNCGPVAVDASQTDVSEGGDADVLEYSVLLFEGPDDLILPAATLRPETLFGVTNMWLNPDVEYAVAEVGGKRWLISEEGLKKIKYQLEGVKEVGRLKGSELIGKTCRVPYTGREVPILPGPFVDPKVATGVVMSVPAHAPYDWIALEDLKKEEEDPWRIKEIVKKIEPITIIKSRKYPMEDPAGHIVKRMGIRNQHEKEKLEEATKEIYKEEFHSGVLNDVCMDYAGLRVSEIKDTLKVDLMGMGLIVPFYDFSKEVICRCGERVVIKRIEEQWFIRYSDEDLTERSIEHSKRMMIYPEEYKRELPGVLEWFSDRACIRQGSWLGTEFPFAKGWIIEPISDSTLYPAYYIVSKYVNSGELKVEWMDERFFDYVYLGRGEISDFPEERRGVIERIRRDFLYWYPLDINLGGKEHKTVHFPVFIMNHVAVMPEEAWPRGIFVHWWVTQKGGEKIAKSKGGAEPIPDAIAHYGVDSMRLYYCHVGSPEMDIEWREEVVKDYQTRLTRILSMVRENVNGGGEVKEGLKRYLEAAISRRMREYLEAMENYSLRDAANTVFFQTFQDLRWYFRRGGVG
ncbi:MAG: leucine--tRNA ligase, partial [Thermoplasmata archaeon]|nr:leucine--tRNA ligase [Thermoplasmata archaeon]